MLKHTEVRPSGKALLFVTVEKKQEKGIKGWQMERSKMQDFHDENKLLI